MLARTLRIRPAQLSNLTLNRQPGIARQLPPAQLRAQLTPKA
jgi:hypothetical protein